MSAPQEDSCMPPILPGRYRQLALIFGAVAAIVLCLAYQIKRPATVRIGAPGDYHYLVSGFYYPEQVGQDTFRWTAQRSEITFPGLGSSAPVRLRLALHGWRPESSSPPTVTLTVNNQLLAVFAPGPVLSAQEFIVPPEITRSSPNLRVALQSSNVFVPQDTMGGQDSRKLGLLVASAEAQQMGGILSPILPPLVPLALLWVSVVGTVTLATQIGARPRWSAGIGAVALALAIYAVGWQRLTLARLAWAPCMAVLAANGLAVAARWAASGARRVALDERAALIAMLLAIGSVRYFQQAVFAPRDIPPVDFAVDYTGATVVRRGEMLYDLAALRRANDEVITPHIVALHETVYNSYDNPPFTAVLVLPFTGLPFGQAKDVYRLLLHLLYFSSVALVLGADRAYRSHPQWVLIVMLALCLEPVYSSITSGQVDIPILFAMYVVYWAFKRGHPVLAGCAIAVAAMIKLSPALLLIYFLYKRQFKVVISGVMAVVVLLGIGIAVTGADDWIIFVREILPVLAKGSTHFENQTLVGFFNGLFLTPSALFSLQPVPPLVIPKVLTWITVGGVGLLMLRLFWPRSGETLRDGLRFDLEFSLCMVALLIASSVAWQHYYVWLLLPLATLLRSDVREWLTSRGYVFGAAALGLSVVLILFPISIFFLWPVDFYATHWEMRLLFWAKLYGALIVFGLLAFLLWRVRGRHTIADKVIADTTR
jgi:Glycosyltransferase family 87